MTCKDCYHDGIGCCFTGVEEVEKICKHFKDKSTVAEVVRGRWVKDNLLPTHCSVCGELPLRHRSVEYERLSPYCPGCGAKMDLGRSGYELL